MFGIIYKATFPNGKIYIGQTKQTLEQRKLNHLRGAMKKKKPKNDYLIYRAINKYGINNAKWEVIDFADNQVELDNKEIYWIDYYKSYIGFSKENGYNMTLGGRGITHFTQLNDEELINFGKDCRLGMPTYKLIEKYNITKRFYNDLVRGRIFNSYTKIPSVDWYDDKNGGVLNKYQICVILREFKKIGSVDKIAQEYKVNRNSITNILLGKTWSNFTGIIDESFFNRYNLQKSKLSKDEILELINKYENENISRKQLAKEFNIGISTLSRILNGQSYSNITKIEYKNKQNRKQNNTKKINFLTDDLIKQIYEESKYKTTEELIVKFHISKSSINRIKNGTIGSNITGQPLKKTLKGAEITLEDAQEIARLWKEEHKSKTEIVKIMGGKITYNIVSGIVSGRTWTKYIDIKQ